MTTPSDKHWEERFSDLAEYVRKHGAPAILKPDRREKLRKWVMEQRKNAARGKLPAGQSSRLEALFGIAVPDADARWDARFEELRAFHQRTGHCRVPARDKPFSRWINAQRERKRRGILLPGRVERLESLGFEWKPFFQSVVLEERWQQKYERLLRFRQEHGHTEVPRTFRDRGLGEWVHEQRKNYRAGLLRADRREQLEAVGFAWDAKPRSPRLGWETKFAQLVAYRGHFGHCRVPQRWEEDRSLGRWVDRLRLRKWDGTLSADCIRRLEEIGFEWSIRKGRNKKTNP